MKNWWIILTIGIILRIFLSVATFHSDLEVFNRAGQLIAEGNILNLYDFSSDSGVFNYPPLIYWFHGLFTYLPYLQLKLPYLIFDRKSHGE